MDMGKRVIDLIGSQLKRNIYYCVFAVIAVIMIAYTLAADVRRVSDAADMGTEKEGRVNVLVMGTDRQASLCDVMMLVSIDKAENTVVAVQIPRDTYAGYTSGNYKKLNGAYNSLGGAEQTAAWLADAFGIRIDHYVCVCLDTVRRAVDAIGGVDVDIPCDMVYSDPEQGLYIKLDAGKTHLDGEGAEQFLRFRYSYVDGDVARLDAHKIFLSALYKKMARDMTPSLLIKLMGSGLEM